VNASVMTLEEIRVAGLRALSRDLGAVGLVRFLQQFEMGSGDYTAERHQWLDGNTVQDVVQQIKERRQAYGDSSSGISTVA
jgi:hypothetical protein